MRGKSKTPYVEKVERCARCGREEYDLIKTGKDWFCIWVRDCERREAANKRVETYMALPELNVALEV